MFPLQERLVKDIEKEMPKDGFFFKKNDCPKCGATSDEYYVCQVDKNGYTISCNQCPKGSV